MTFIPSEETETEEPKAKKPKVEQPSSSSVTFRVSCKLAGHAANKLDAQVPCKSDFENLHKPKILLASRLSSWPLYTPNEFVYCSGGLQVLRKGPAREVRLESEFEKPDTRGKVPTRQGWRGGGQLCVWCRTIQRFTSLVADIFSNKQRWMDHRDGSHEVRAFSVLIFKRNSRILSNSFND